MTSQSSLFHTYIPSSCHEKIHVADGSFSAIAGKGLIHLSPNICLKSALHVPKLACNLLSVSKLAQDCNCSVTFYETHCVFQEQTTRKMTGSAKLIDGLYYFVEDDSRNKGAHGLRSICSASVKDEILLWHSRLGHPSFPYLKKIMPQLFNSVDCSKLECEHCILSKSHKFFYPAKSYTPSKLFYLIHSDVWVPLRSIQFLERDGL